MTGLGFVFFFFFPFFTPWEYLLFRISPKLRHQIRSSTQQKGRAYLPSPILMHIIFHRHCTFCAQSVREETKNLQSALAFGVSCVSMMYHVPSSHAFAPLARSPYTLFLSLLFTSLFPDTSVV